MGWHLRTLFVVALLLLAGCSTGTTPQSGNGSTNTGPSVGSGSASTSEETVAERATVLEVVDGDTLDIRYPDGTTDTIRLLGVDTPEVHTDTDPEKFPGIADTQAGNDWLRDWGHKASEFVRTEVGGQVRIVVDQQADRRGSYGRLLAYVYADGALLNEALLRQGYARMYDSSFSRRGEFGTLEEEARGTDVGLWAFEGPTDDAVDDVGDTSGSLSVARIHADATGNDHENLHDEYVVFENRGDSSLDLSGWSVRDAADHVYIFPKEVTIAPGARVTLYTGSGSDTDGERYWNSDSAIWNNGGDTVLVTRTNGSTVLQESY